MGFNIDGKTVWCPMCGGDPMWNRATGAIKCQECRKDLLHCSAEEPSTKKADPKVRP